MFFRGLILFLVITTSLLIMIATINFYGDGGYQFHRAPISEQMISKALLNNKSALVCTNYNDRNVKKIILNKMIWQPDILILGSSRTLPIHTIFIDKKKIFNASLTSASLEDDMVIYYLYQKRGWKPQKILICLDPWLINSSGINLWKSVFLSDYDKALQFFTNKKNSLPYSQYLIHSLEKYIVLLSPYYLRETLQNLRLSYANNIIINPNPIQIASFPSCYLHLPDGARLPSSIEELTSATQADYEGHVEVHRYIPDQLKVDKNKAKLFEQFIGYLINERIEVIFYLPPYEPMAYSEIVGNQNYQAIKQTEQYFRQLGSKYHIKIIGSYNPFVLHLSSADFIDDIHLKKQGIDKLFAYV